MSMLRFGIVGTNVISDWFAEAVASRADATVAAVYSRATASGDAFAQRHGIASATTHYEAMLDAVDAVYIASPIIAHHPQAMTALAAGRHVLVEKTMAGSAPQITQIQSAAAASGLIAMEAVRSLYTPAYAAIRAGLDRLGTLRQASLSKQQYSSRYDAFRAGEILRAFDPALENSALADIGVYALQPALDLFGLHPDTADGASVYLHNGFEGAGTLTLGYPGTVVSVSWSKITHGVTPSVITGEDASLVIDDLAETGSVVLRPRGGTPETLFAQTPPAPGNTMSGEIDAFLAQVASGVPAPHRTEVTLAARRLMDAHLARPYTTSDSALR